MSGVNLMNITHVYRDTGEKLFENGNSIYINNIIEGPEPHLHVHDFIEISYVTSGCGVHILGDKEYRVNKGDLFLINYHIPHEFRSFQSPDTEPINVYNCVFKPEFIDVNLIDYKDFKDVIQYLSFRSIFSLNPDTVDDLKLSEGENPALEHIYKKMLKEFTEKEDGYIELLRGYLIELLIQIFRSMKASFHKKTDMMSRHASLMEQSIQYLKSNYKVNVKLSELASRSFLSPTYYCKLFKDYTGATISEYIQKLRIEEACNLLKTTDLKVIAVAQKIGYSDIKHFNEVFKKLTGTTPSAYKKSH